MRYVHLKLDEVLFQQLFVKTKKAILNLVDGFYKSSKTIIIANGLKWQKHHFLIHWFRAPLSKRYFADKTSTIPLQMNGMWHRGFTTTKLYFPIIDFI